MKPRAESVTASTSVPVNSLDNVRPRPAKASLRSQSQSIALTAVVKDALQRHYGTLKGAAKSMEPPMDEGQLSRELTTGHFQLEKLERLDLDGQAAVAHALYEAFGDNDPRVTARRLIRALRQHLDELAEVIAS